MARFLGIKNTQKIDHHDIKTLVRSVALGCELCALLFQHVVYHRPGIHERTAVVRGRITLTSLAVPETWGKRPISREPRRPALLMRAFFEAPFFVHCSVRSAQNDSWEVEFDPSVRRTALKGIKREDFLSLMGVCS